ncbi:MAG TPA: LiaF domain-containing protein [Gemmatimonadaceae bacterium]|nr:LiaF domain-containing protein [Gemmatimonadaceae bacterium]
MTPRSRHPVAPLPPAHPTVVAAALVPEHRGAVAFLSHALRDDDWILPRRFRAVAFLGQVELDLSRARIGPGTSEIEVVAIMGNITILVPPELRVECDGDPIVGSFEIKRDVAATAMPDAPLIRVIGTAFMSAVEVKIIDPNAPGWFEKLRARWAATRG